MPSIQRRNSQRKLTSQTSKNGGGHQFDCFFNEMRLLRICAPITIILFLLERVVILFKFEKNIVALGVTLGDESDYIKFHSPSVNLFL